MSVKVTKISQLTFGELSKPPYAFEGWQSWECLEFEDSDFGIGNFLKL